MRPKTPLLRHINIRELLFDSKRVVAAPEPICSQLRFLPRRPNRSSSQRSEGSAFHAASAPNNRAENQNDMSRSSGHGFSRAKPAATDSGFIR